MEHETKDHELLAEIRQRFQSYSQFWSENYKQGDLDMDCLSADYGPWDQDEIARRKNLNRPIVHIDIISQFNRRIVNQARLNPRGIVITPKGSDATDDTAGMREDRIRQIDYESLALPARINAIQNAVDRGIGFYMVATEYDRPDDFDQKIGTRQIPNSKSVLIDPYAKQPDYSDMQGAFVIDRYEHSVYRSKFPDAKVRSFTDEYLILAPGWIDEKSVQVCEYWKVKTQRRKLLLLDTQQGRIKQYLEDLAGAKLKQDILNWNGTQIPVIKQRTVEVHTVMQYITNGLEILNERKWEGSTIPIVMVTGYRKYEKDKLVIESATRKMRAGQLLYDYATTCEQEVLGMAPKSHWTAVAGQTEDFKEWDDANRDPTAVLRYRAKTPETGDAILAQPQRVDYSPPIEALELARQSALIAVQQAAGMFSVDRQDRIAKSGKAIQRQNESQDLGNYHFADYLDMAIQYEGRIKNELLDKIEDTDTVRGFRKADDSYERKPVTPMIDPESGEIIEHPYGKGSDHDVIVKAGPSMQSQWDKAADFLDILAGNPQYAPLVMDLVVTMKQLGPMGKKLSERFEKMLPPQLKDDQQQPQIPPQIQQIIQELTDQLNQAKDSLQNQQVEMAAKVQMNRENNEVKLAVAEITAKTKETADRVEIFLTRMDHALRLIEQSRNQEQVQQQAVTVAP